MHALPPRCQLLAGRILATAVIAAGLVACSTVPPASPTLPPVACDLPDRVAVPVSCDALIAAAVAALPSPSPEIDTLEVALGGFCRGRCAPEVGSRAHVVFHMAPGHDQWVLLETDLNGNVVVTSAVRPFPPAPDATAEPTSVVRSRSFPGIDIRCIGGNLDWDACVAFAEAHLPPQSTHAAGSDHELKEMLLVMTDALCSVRYYGSGHVPFLAQTVACPAV